MAKNGIVKDYVEAYDKPYVRQSIHWQSPESVYAEKEPYFSSIFFELKGTPIEEKVVEAARTRRSILKATLGKINLYVSVILFAAGIGLLLFGLVSDMLLAFVGAGWIGFSFLHLAWTQKTLAESAMSPGGHFADVTTHLRITKLLQGYSK